MKAKLNILILDDDANDAELINRELCKGGLPFRSTRVETRTSFLSRLQADRPDVILSDHGLPAFSGFEALAIAREYCPEVPFIFVTGSIGEEKAIETLKMGAVDYVLKDRLSKLLTAVEQAVREAGERAERARGEAERQQAEAERDRLIQELREALNEVKTLSGLLPICAVCKKIRDYQGYWHPLEVYLRKHSDVTLVHEFCEECAQHIQPARPAERPLLAPRQGGTFAESLSRADVVENQGFGREML